MSEVSVPGRREHRFLRYYGKSLLALGPAGRDWPGFRYTPEEWKRPELHAGTVSAGAGLAATVAAAAIFIVIAAAAIGLVFIPAMTYLYPDPAKTSALVFVASLFAVVLVVIGVGYPIALDLGGRFADRWAADAAVPATAEDRALIAKIRAQIWRMMGLLCGIGVPATMMLIIYDIDLGPVMRWLKPAAYAATALVMAFTAWRARASKV